MKLIIDIPDMIYNILNGDSSWGGLSVDYILNAVKDGTPLEAQPNRCDSCKHSEERDGSNCYECVKGISDNFEAHSTNMRDATEEERKSVKDYVDSISKPTGVNFNELLRDCGTCKHNTGIDCGQYPCNECNRKTHPLYEPKIAQPTDADSSGFDNVINKTVKEWFDKRGQTLVNLEDIIRIYSNKKKTNALNGDDYAFIEAIRECQKFQPCEDAVSRESVLELAKKGILVSNDNYKCVVNAIKSLPPVTSERPKGKWIEEKIIYHGVERINCVECSLCGAKRIDKTKFCCECGAEMVDSQESEDTE